MLKIDLHTHAFPSEYLLKLSEFYPDEVELRETNIGRHAAFVKRPLPLVPFWDQEERLAEIERDSVTVEILSNPLFYTWVDEHSPELARILNDALAGICQVAPERFRAFAHLPFNDMSDTLAELARAVDQLGCIGVIIGTNLAGRYSHTPDFLPFWEEVNRRRLPVFMHPGDPPNNSDDERSSLILFPHETTLSTMKLLYSGLLERFPDLVLILSHLGGTLPFLARRIDMGFELYTMPERYKQIPRPPSEYMGKLYLDTALGWHQPAFQCACELVGIDHIVYGSDHYLRNDPFRQRIDEFLAGLNLSPLEQEKVLGRTADSLFSLARQPESRLL